ncbi:MAG: DUF1232 domain-containing protein [Cetobacterium sp.]|nr:DUF1232 domain-containing protein [Cetobacterium sp.]
MVNKIVSLIGKNKKINLSSKSLKKAFNKAQLFGPLGKDFRIIISLIGDVKNKNYKISKKELGIFVGIVIYVLNPFDLIPDITPLTGLLDDTAIITWGVKRFQKTLDEYKEWKEKSPLY